NLKTNPGDKLAEVEEAVLPVLDDLGNEIHLSFDFFENQFDREVDQVFVSGGSAGLPGLEKSFQRVFERAIEFWDPLKDIAIGGAEVDTAGLKTNASQLAIAVGLASRIREK
ncbi:MAG: pilus assembly protein PilM, partial [Planctomycetota bacterium]|nr:pilus assembly protein PilM [Planctomycetota bacterium]